MKTFLLTVLFIVISGFPALAGTVAKSVTYTIDENIFEGVMVYDDSST